MRNADALYLRHLYCFCDCGCCDSALWAQDNIPRTQAIPAARRTIQTTDGQTLQGQVLAEGMTDLQLRTDDKKIRLLRKADGNRYRVVTSQTDWPTYNGDPSGNRYSKLTQIDKSNVARLAPKWIFPMPGVDHHRKHAPGRRRRDVCGGRERMLGARRRHRPRHLALPA